MLMAAAPGPARVVINEVMYHPPDDRDDLQFVELFNPSGEAIDLSGWSFTKGFEFVFPRGVELAAGAYAVICQDAAALKSHSGAQLQIAGTFKGKLSHSGEQIQLANAQGQIGDAVRYDDQEEWPLGADGYGSSLERICPRAPGNDAANWASSIFRSRSTAGGTPGMRNPSFSDVSLPHVKDVRWEKPAPGKQVTVTATVADTTRVQAPTLAWMATSGEPRAAWADIAMR